VAFFIKLGVIRESQLYTYLIPTWLLWGVGMLLAFLRIVQWSIRARRDGLERIVLTVPHLLGLWLFGFFAWFLFIPWSVGFFWLVIDSLRR
jgi:hypothetical protein